VARLAGHVLASRILHHQIVARLGRLVHSGHPRPTRASPGATNVGGNRVSLTLFCLLVLTVLLPRAGLLTDLERANTARTLAAIQTAERDEDLT
jgi:hypothetical protein